MTALLYYSISQSLNENEVVRIDKEVCINKKVVYIFLTKLPFNTKRKAKKICLYVIFMFAISQPLVPCVAIMMPWTPTAFYKLSCVEESRISTNTTFLNAG